MLENSSVGNKVDFMSGDISYNFLGDTSVTLFNKSIFDDLGWEEPYSLVRDGKWTFDAMTKLAAEGTFDINGDGSIDAENDQVGYITARWRGPTFGYISQGTRLVETNSDKIPELALNTERAASIFERYLDFLHSDASYMCDEANYAEMVAKFSKKNIMFFDAHIKQTANMCDMVEDYGTI
jgi:hypothetical protein